MMKKITLIIYLVFSYSVFSQTDKNASYGGEFKFNSERTPCLTDTQRAAVIQNLKDNQAELRRQNKLVSLDSRIPNPLFIWPVQKASNVTYNEIWGLSNYVDHNVGFPNQITDYNGGSHSYDTASGYNHQGLDIFSWPFSWKMVDDNGAEVIAASAGQIISKTDGNFDRSCNFNNNQWNAVFIRHNDGSVDLHFEVYEDDTYTYDKLIDPYVGPSNNWNTTSWWASQKPYRNPTINAALTHTADPNFGNCPDTVVALV